MNTPTWAVAACLWLGIPSVVFAVTTAWCWARWPREEWHRYRAELARVLPGIMLAVVLMGPLAVWLAWSIGNERNGGGSGDDG